VHAECLLALGVLEDVYRIMWVCMHRTHDPSRLVGPNRYQTQVKRTPELANLCKCGTHWVLVLWAMVIGTLGELWDGSVSSVSIK